MFCEAEKTLSLNNHREDEYNWWNGKLYLSNRTRSPAAKYSQGKSYWGIKRAPTMLELLTQLVLS